MGYDLRRNPDPATLRGRTWYAVDGWDVADGARLRCLFSAANLNHAVHLAIRNGLCGEMYEVRAAVLIDWQRWADSLIPDGIPKLILPLPSDADHVGTLEPHRPVTPHVHVHHGAH